MIDLTVHKKFRYILFGSLYFAEGLYQVIIMLITPLYLIDKNVSIPIITLVMAFGQLPWGLKFIWGGIADFYHKYGRKKFTFFGTILGALSFLILSLIDQFFSIIFFALFLFIGHIGVGFLDATTDAWVIDVSKKEERGKINASMNAGKNIGYSLFGPLLVIIGVTYGYNISFITTGLIVLIIAIIVSFVKYSEAKPYEEKILFLIKNEFKKKSTKITTLFIFIATINPALMLSIIVLYAKIVLNLDDTTIGLITALMLLVIVPGTILGGIIADKYGRIIPLYIFLIMVIFSCIGFAFAYDLITVIIFLAILDFAWALEQPCIWALAMDITNSKVGASQLSIIYSIANLGDVGASAIAGTLVIMIGFQNVFLLSGIVLIPAIITLYKLKGNNIK